MFETVVRKEPSLLAYGAQQFAAPLLPLLAVLIVSPLFSALPDSEVLLIGNLVFALIVAFSLGRFARDHFPTAAEGGRWVWIIPSLFMSAGLVHDAVQFSMGYCLREFFFPAPQGEAGLCFLLITVPVFSSICYSIACVRTRRRDQQTFQGAKVQ